MENRLNYDGIQCDLDPYEPENFRALVFSLKFGYFRILFVATH